MRQNALDNGYCTYEELSLNRDIQPINITNGIADQLLVGEAKLINIFNLPTRMPEEEVSEALIPDTGILIERIISTGQTTPPDVWYDQERDEWVMLLQGSARIAWENGKVMSMQPGDWVLIPAHERHRVDYTSSQPPCIWLAVHAKLA